MIEILAAATAIVALMFLSFKTGTYTGKEQAADDMIERVKDTVIPYIMLSTRVARLSQDYMTFLNKDPKMDDIIKSIGEFTTEHNKLMRAFNREEAKLFKIIGIKRIGTSADDYTFTERDLLGEEIKGD